MAPTTALSKRSKLSHLECSKCASGTDADAPESSDPAEKFVAVCRGAARLCAAHARGGDDAAGADGAAGRRDGTQAPLREGRSVEPHRLVQGARDGRGSGTGEAL